MNSILRLAMVLLCLAAARVNATGWCDFEPGWQVITHGSKSDKVWIFGTLKAQQSVIWVQINNPGSAVGDTSVSVALAAQFAGRRLQFYIDDANTCSTFPNWGSQVRHLRVVD
jgi:hypothetical protein